MEKKGFLLMAIAAIAFAAFAQQASALIVNAQTFPSETLQAGQEAVFVVLLTGKQPFNYSFDFGDGSAKSGDSAENLLQLTHSFQKEGKYTVEFTVTDSAGETEKKQLLEIQVTKQYMELTIVNPSPQAVLEKLSDLEVWAEVKSKLAGARLLNARVSVDLLQVGGQHRISFDLNKVQTDKTTHQGKIVLKKEIFNSYYLRVNSSYSMEGSLRTAYSGFFVKLKPLGIYVKNSFTLFSKTYYPSTAVGDIQPLLVYEKDDSPVIDATASAVLEDNSGKILAESKLERVSGGTYKATIPYIILSSDLQGNRIILKLFAQDSYGNILGGESGFFAKVLPVAQKNPFFELQVLQPSGASTRGFGEKLEFIAKIVSEKKEQLQNLKLELVSKELGMRKEMERDEFFDNYKASVELPSAESGLGKAGFSIEASAVLDGEAVFDSKDISVSISQQQPLVLPEIPYLVPILAALAAVFAVFFVFFFYSKRVAHRVSRLEDLQRKREKILSALNSAKHSYALREITEAEYLKKKTDLEEELSFLNKSIEAATARAASPAISKKIGEAIATVKEKYKPPSPEDEELQKIVEQISAGKKKIEEVEEELSQEKEEMTEVQKKLFGLEEEQEKLPEEIEELPAPPGEAEEKEEAEKEEEKEKQRKGGERASGEVDIGALLEKASEESLFENKEEEEKPKEEKLVQAEPEKKHLAARLGFFGRGKKESTIEVLSREEIAQVRMLVGRLNQLKSRYSREEMVKAITAERYSTRVAFKVAEEIYGRL